MRKFTQLAIIVSIAAALGSAHVVYAESAPVYDADSAPQATDGSDQGQDLPPPPSPDQSDVPAPGDQATPAEQGSEQDNTFVPAQQVAPQTAPRAQAATPPPYASATLGVDQRLKRLEQQLNNMQTGDSAQRIDSLQDQVQTLRGQVEQLMHQLEQLQAQQKSMYNDLDKRVSQAPAPTKAAPIEDSAIPGYRRKTPSSKAQDVIAAPAVTPSAAATKTTVNQPNVAEEQQIYQTAYEQIKSKKYTDAIATLQTMLKKYPSGQFASNAHYWLGELYGIIGKSDQALTEFVTVVKSYPDSPRIADAQLKVGLIYATQSNWPDAKSAFKKVINHYPGTASSRLASEQLKQLKQAGH